MEISFDFQLQVLLCSFALGAFLGLIYNFICFFGYISGTKNVKLKGKFLQKYEQNDSKSKSTKKVIAFLLDVLYFIVITPLVAVSLFLLNKGIIRWYISLSIMLGFTVYKFSVGRLVTKAFFLAAVFLRILTVGIYKRLRVKKSGAKLPR